MNRTQIHLVDEEVDFPSNEQLVSTTDLQGVITYANDHFCRVAGYSRAEMIGQHHNMVRHPDMPKAAFADLWGKLKQGKPWRGMVKNRCKDGRYYWVDAYVTPIFEQGRISGYQSVRNRAEPGMKAVAAVRVRHGALAGDHPVSQAVFVAAVGIFAFEVMQQGNKDHGRVLSYFAGSGCKQKRQTDIPRFAVCFWSRVRDPNPPPAAWEAAALPDELTLQVAHLL